MHKGTAHVGKVPARLAQIARARDSELKDLQRDLRKAVSDEDYESAAQIRDQIRQFDAEAEPVMAIHNILTNTGEWLRGEGPHHQIVVSSRVRLARNLQQLRLSRLGEEGGAAADPRDDQAAGRRAAGDGGRVLGLFAGSLRAGKAGARRAASHFPRARGEGRRLARW